MNIQLTTRTQFAPEGALKLGGSDGFWGRWVEAEWGGGAGLEGKQMLGLGGTPEQGWEWVSQAERRLRKSIGHQCPMV